MKIVANLEDKGEMNGFIGFEGDQVLKALARITTPEDTFSWNVIGSLIDGHKLSIEIKWQMDGLASIMMPNVEQGTTILITGFFQRAEVARNALKVFADNIWDEYENYLEGNNYKNDIEQSIRLLQEMCQFVESQLPFLKGAHVYLAKIW